MPKKKKKNPLPEEEPNLRSNSLTGHQGIITPSSSSLLLFEDGARIPIHPASIPSAVKVGLERNPLPAAKDLSP